MEVKQVIDYFGNQNKIAKALGITRGAVCEWVRSNKIPPARQIQIQRITNGKIKVL